MREISSHASRRAAPRVSNAMRVKVFEFRNTPFRKMTKRGFSTPLLSKSGKSEVEPSSNQNDARRCELRDYNKEQKKRNTIHDATERDKAQCLPLGATRQFQDRARQDANQRAQRDSQGDIAQERTQRDADACAQYNNHQNTSEQRRKRLDTT